jgi:hypothetical protein
MADSQDAVVRRLYEGVRTLAKPRGECALKARDGFGRGGVLGGDGFSTRNLELVFGQSKMRHGPSPLERQSVLDCVEMVGLIDARSLARQRDGRHPRHKLTSLGEALIPILGHEGMASEFVWYVLWINLSCTWLGALAWNMLTRRGPSVPLLAEPMCSYLSGEDPVDSQDRGAASSLEYLFRSTPWGDLGIGQAPAHGRRLWLRIAPQRIDPLVVLYGLYKAVEVSDMPTIDVDQLASLPYGPCMTLGIDRATAVHHLLSLWLPGLLTQRREGDRVIFSIQTDRNACDVVKEYARRRGYQ